jgi:hypothetical protein
VDKKVFFCFQNPTKLYSEKDLIALLNGTSGSPTSSGKANKQTKAPCAPLVGDDSLELAPAFNPGANLAAMMKRESYAIPNRTSSRCQLTQNQKRAACWQVPQVPN